MEMVPERLQFGPFILDVATRSLSRGGNEIHLAPKSFDLLHYFLLNPGRVLDKDLLLREVWHDVAVEEGNLTQHISLLRKALGTAPHGDPYIQTHPKAGYAFAVPVHSVGRRSQPGLFTRRNMAITSLLPLVAIAFYSLGRFTSPAARVYAIRVEPFVCLPGDPGLRRLCEILQKQIVDELALFPRYRITLSAATAESREPLVCRGLLRPGAPPQFELTIHSHRGGAPLWQYSSAVLSSDIDQTAAQARAALHSYLHAREQTGVSTSN